jgi:hypothetical protein
MILMRRLWRSKHRLLSQVHHEYFFPRKREKGRMRWRRGGGGRDMLLVKFVFVALL